MTASDLNAARQIMAERRGCGASLAQLDSSPRQRKAEIEPVIASEGKVADIVICAKSFPGRRNFEAFVSYLKFMAAHHRQIGDREHFELLRDRSMIHGRSA